MFILVCRAKTACREPSCLIVLTFGIEMIRHRFTLDTTIVNNKINSNVNYFGKAYCPNNRNEKKNFRILTFADRRHLTERGRRRWVIIYPNKFYTIAAHSSATKIHQKSFKSSSILSRSGNRSLLVAIA